MLLENEEVDAVIEQLGMDDRLLLAESMLGEDAMQFMTSDMGRYLAGRVNQDRTEAYLALAKTSWWRKRRIVQLQQRIEMAESLMSYIRDIIMSGKSALAELDKRSSTGEM